MRTIIFDVESTGTTRPQVCQLAYIIAADDGLKAQNYFFEADAMNRYAYKVHHLSLSALKTLSGGQRFADRAGEIRRDFSSADVFAGHGAALLVPLEQFGKVRVVAALGQTVLYIIRIATDKVQIQHRYSPPIKCLECVSKREIRRFEWIFRQFKEETRRLSSAKSSFVTQKWRKRRRNCGLRNF